jgi:hypothetical protein
LEASLRKVEELEVQPREKRKGMLIQVQEVVARRVTQAPTVERAVEMQLLLWQRIQPDP